MLYRRGVPFPVQDDTEKEPVVNPIERVEGTQSLTQEKTFDYVRALPPELANLQIDVRESDVIVNPQPKTPLVISIFQRMGIIAEKPISDKLVADHLNFANRFNRQRIYRKNYIDESIPKHQPGFGNPQRKTEHPGKEGEVAKRDSMNFLDKFFNWVNSVLGE